MLSERLVSMVMVWFIASHCASHAASNDDSSGSLSAARAVNQAVLPLIDAQRAAGATCGADGSYTSQAPLRYNALLAAAAQGHAQDMASQHYFSHQSLDGSTLAQRVTHAGYAFSAVGENILAGSFTYGAAVKAWMDSPGHCANIMSSGYTEAGLGYAPGLYGAPYQAYWVLNLGTASK